MRLADRIRQYVFQKYISPARNRGQTTVTVIAGQIHKEMGLENNMPAVCGALGTIKFQKEYKIKLLKRSPLTQSSTVQFFY